MVVALPKITKNIILFINNFFINSASLFLTNYNFYWLSWWCKKKKILTNSKFLWWFQKLPLVAVFKRNRTSTIQYQLFKRRYTSWVMLPMFFQMCPRVNHGKESCFHPVTVTFVWSFSPPQKVQEKCFWLDQPGIVGILNGW